MLALTNFLDPLVSACVLRGVGATCPYVEGSSSRQSVTLWRSNGMSEVSERTMWLMHVTARFDGARGAHLTITPDPPPRF